MKINSDSFNQINPPEVVRRRLAAAYELILSWPEPPDIETADRDNFDEETQPAGEAPAQDERSA